MATDFSIFTRGELIKRALQEEHASIRADSPEARASHAQLAQLLRDRAVELESEIAASAGQPLLTPFPIGQRRGWP